ncbi:hypothetical protein H2203_003651 [Taxawa tesnikishii (nom. ined.)]|nr:hypothetical protein H2203_003651 [Dothideales sp. JES 119]
MSLPAESNAVTVALDERVIGPESIRTSFVELAIAVGDNVEKMETIELGSVATGRSTKEDELVVEAANEDVPLPAMNGGRTVALERGEVDSEGTLSEEVFHDVENAEAVEFFIVAVGPIMNSAEPEELEEIATVSIGMLEEEMFHINAEAVEFFIAEVAPTMNGEELEELEGMATISKGMLEEEIFHIVLPVVIRHSVGIGSAELVEFFVVGIWSDEKATDELLPAFSTCRDEATWTVIDEL